MKLGKGPTSLLDRHSTLDDVTALPLCTRFLFFLPFLESYRVSHDDDNYEDDQYVSTLLSNARNTMTRGPCAWTTIRSTCEICRDYAAD